MSRVPLEAPVAGWLTNIRNVPDAVFSEEMMGVGFAIDPTDGTVVAPCAGQILLIAPTNHSVTLRTDEGAELLIHVGLETVALAGRGFKAHVRDGDRVQPGDALITFDMDLVGLEAKSLVTPVVLTNSGEFRLTIEHFELLVERAQPIGSIERTRPSKIAVVQDQEGERGDAEVGFAHGLHARPAARIAALAKSYPGTITLALGGKSAKARSPVAIMGLNAKKGDRVDITATGERARDAVEAIAALISAGEEAERVLQRPVPKRAIRGKEIAGVCALPGIAVGTAVHWRRKVPEAVEQGRGVDEERTALEEALSIVRARLEALGAEMGDTAAAIARAHIGLVEDEELNTAALREIEQGRSAAKAWQLATAAAADDLRAADNPLLRERVADLEDISAQVTSVLAGEARPTAIEFDHETILLADELLPSELMSLPRERLSGLATGGGGATSHVALIAASFGVPTLVAMGPELTRIPEGSRVLLNATAGVLVIDPDRHAEARALAVTAQIRSEGGDCVTRDGERISLLANLGSPADVEPAIAAGAEGCGLLRTEFLFLDRSEPPSEEEQRRAYQAIVDGLSGRPLTIRTLDVGGDKPVPYIRFPHEQNPALGARGIRTVLFRPELMDEQLRAIGRVNGAPIKVMVPMISSVSELRSVRERVAALGEQITLGVMVETPAAALLADRLAEEADFLSIGSNDLAQYALAMDRTNPLLATLIDALHPAVLKLIAMTTEAAQRSGTPVSLCGNLASDPVGALLLVGLGIRELSGVPAALPAVRHAIRQVSTEDCRSLAVRALELESAAQVRALAAELLNASAEGEAE